MAEKQNGWMPILLFLMILGMVVSLSVHLSSRDETQEEKEISWREKLGRLFPGMQVKKTAPTTFGVTSEQVELVTGTKDLDQTYEFSWSVAGLVRHIKLRGQFTAKAGFVIDEKFKFIVSEDGKSVRVQHPRAQILSCEMTNYEVIREGDWWLNRLSARDREIAMQMFLKLARKDVEESSLLVEATNGLSKRLEPLRQTEQITVIMEPLP